MERKRVRRKDNDFEVDWCFICDKSYFIRENIVRNFGLR